jgi:hypothetical protein
VRGPRGRGRGAAHRLEVGVQQGEHVAQREGVAEPAGRALQQALGDAHRAALVHAAEHRLRRGVVDVGGAGAQQQHRVGRRLAAAHLLLGQEEARPQPAGELLHGGGVEHAEHLVREQQVAEDVGADLGGGARGAGVAAASGAPRG